MDARRIAALALAVMLLAGACASGADPLAGSGAPVPVRASSVPSAGSAVTGPTAAAGSSTAVVSTSATSTWGAPTPAVSTPAAPTAATAIVPGAVDRTSIDVRATYDVKLTLRYATGTLHADSTMRITNRSGAGIDRLELNTVAAALGRMHVTDATVDGSDVAPQIDDMTLIVPLGGILPDGASATVQLGLGATLRTGTSGSDWLFTKSSGIITMYRWLPWISLERPFDRAAFGFPFLTPVSPKVTLEVTTDRAMRLATGARRTHVDGLTQRFVAEDVRDLNIAASPFFRSVTGKVGDRTIFVFYRKGAPGATMLDWAKRALVRLEARLGPYPYPVVHVAQSASRTYAAASPGLVWLPTGVRTGSVPYFMTHELAHQWFFGLVGNDLADQPFAHEGTSEFMARSMLGLQRPSRCATARLDLTIYQYSSACFYEIVYVQGSSFLDTVRRRMGDTAFWHGIRAYLDAHRFGFGGTKLLLQALDRATSLDLRTLFHPRFPRYF